MSVVVAVGISVRVGVRVSVAVLVGLAIAEAVAVGVGADGTFSILSGLLGSRKSRVSICPLKVTSMSPLSQSECTYGESNSAYSFQSTVCPLTFGNLLSEG